MNDCEIAISYIRYFCAGNIDALVPLLAANLTFKGTLQSFSSADDYIAALRKDPPEKAHCNIQSITNAPHAIAVFYQYIKKNQTIQIAQLFRISDQQITDILLVFDKTQK